MFELTLYFLVDAWDKIEPILFYFLIFQLWNHRTRLLYFAQWNFSTNIFSPTSSEFQLFLHICKINILKEILSCFCNFYIIKCQGGISSWCSSWNFIISDRKLVIFIMRLLNQNIKIFHIVSLKNCINSASLTNYIIFKICWQILKSANDSINLHNIWHQMYKTPLQLPIG